MNMLTNKVPHGLLSKEEQEMFEEVGVTGLDMYLEGWSFACGKICPSHAYRLNPKVDEWYATIPSCGGSYTIAQHDGRPVVRSDFMEFRPATKEEIESVAPSFKHGDVVISDEFMWGESDKRGHILYRFKNTIKNSSQHEVGSIILADGKFEFDTECGTTDKHHHATPEQIEQLEREEMKHGKKWNGGGYDDFLTADGLTLNELLEHDLSEIEKYHIGDEVVDEGWGESRHNSKVSFEMIVIKKKNLITYRLKPQVCIIAGCTNSKKEGAFVGDICSPCHNYIITGEIGATNSFLGELKMKADMYDKIEEITEGNW